MLAQDASSNGGDASRVGIMKEKNTIQALLNNSCTIPDAGRVALSLQQLSGAAANLQTLLNRTL